MGSLAGISLHHGGLGSWPKFSLRQLMGGLLEAAWPGLPAYMLAHLWKWKLASAVETMLQSCFECQWLQVQRMLPLQTLRGLSALSARATPLVSESQLLCDCKTKVPFSQQQT